MREVDPRELKEMAEAWVRAEFAFRLGPNAYQQEQTDWFIEAENELRRAISGEPGLGKAARSLGSPGADELEREELAKPLKRKHLTVRKHLTPERKRLNPELF